MHALLSTGRGEARQRTGPRVGVGLHTWALASRERVWGIATGALSSVLLLLFLEL